MSKKNAPYICPKCGHDSPQSINKDLYEGLTAKGVEVPLLCVTFECPKCGEVWHEVFIIEYDGYVLKSREYDREGDLLIDWQNEIITPKGEQK